MAQQRPRSQRDYFVAGRGDFEVRPTRWQLKYEQPDGMWLVTTVNEFLTYCAQFRPNEKPDLVLKEVVDTGAIQDAPESFLRELEQGGWVTRGQGVFTVVR